MTIVKTETGTVYRFNNGRIYRDASNNVYNLIDKLEDGLCFKHMAPVEVGMPMVLRVYGYEDWDGIRNGRISTSRVTEIVTE